MDPFVAANLYPRARGSTCTKPCIDGGTEPNWTDVLGNCLLLEVGVKDEAVVLEIWNCSTLLDHELVGTTRVSIRAFETSCDEPIDLEVDTGTLERCIGHRYL